MNLIVLTLDNFLLLASVQKGIKRMRENANLLSVKVKIDELEGKVFLTRHDVEGCVSSRGFRVEKITDVVSVIVPPSLIILKS